jgi:hypothetical protein
MIKIVEKYFTQNDFSKREKEVLEIATSKTGFIPQVVLFKGMIFDPDKIGSIIYKGIYKGKPAVLKLQGLHPETDEVDILIGFKKQNKSKIVRLPDLYEYQKWNEKDGFGFLVTEYVPYPKIHEMPFPNNEQIKLFCDFYQEYKTKCLNSPFVITDEVNNAKTFVIKRAETWKKISDYKKVLEKTISREEIEKIVNIYKSFMSKHMESKMELMHGHLSSKDILYNGKEFVLLSNLYWTYRPELYDLMFNLHWCLEAINDEKFTLDRYVKFVKKWFKYFYQIPFVKADDQAIKNIHLMLLERTMGAILIDTGSRNEISMADKHLLTIQIDFFNELIKRISKKDYF